MGYHIMHWQISIIILYYNFVLFFQPPKASKKPKECLHMRSIWDKNYRIRPKVGLKETQNIDRPNLAGKEVQISSRVLKKKSPSKRKSQGKLNQEILEVFCNSGLKFFSTIFHFHLRF